MNQLLHSLCLYCVLIVLTPNSSDGWFSDATPSPSLPRPFVIKIKRQSVNKHLVSGTISLNDTIIGKTYENDEVMIQPGKYPAHIRYKFNKVKAGLGPYGALAKVGDFGIELLDVKDAQGKPREGILFHAGNAPHHSQGCILLGPAYPTSSGATIGTGTLDFDATTGQFTYKNGNPFVVLRKKFYGTETPVSSPDVAITVIVEGITP